MNFSELWPLLLDLSAQSGSGHRLALKVLYSKRNQPLLVPLSTQQAHHAVNFFINNPMLKLWGHVLIKLDHYLPFLHLLPIVEFEHFPLNALFGEIDSDRSIELHGISIFCGFPGPLQKLTIYCPNGLGGIGKVAKVAVHTTANEAIKKESDWLKRLSHTSTTARFLPRLLQHSTLNYKRHCLTMMSLPIGMSPKTFGAAHHEFLRVLAQQKPVFTEWKDSEAHMRLKRRIDSLSSIVDHHVWSFWQDVIAEIERMTARCVLPNLMIHGDFAPWNLRMINDDLFVFDWEYAETNGNPLQDFLHFHLIQQVLSHGALNNKTMSSLLQQTITYVDNQYGLDAGVGKACGPLTIHYLLDTISFYAETSGYLDSKHPVLHNYIKMLEQRAQWLPKTTALPTTNHIGLKMYDAELEIT